MGKLQAEKVKIRDLMTKMKGIYNTKQAMIEKLNNEIASLKSSRATTESVNDNEDLNELRAMKASLEMALEAKEKNIEEFKLASSNACSGYKKTIAEKLTAISTL